MFARRTLITASVALAATLAACSPAPQNSGVSTPDASTPPATQSATTSASASPTTSSSAVTTPSSNESGTPTANASGTASTSASGSESAQPSAQTQPEQGTNHIASAKAYAYPAKDVHDWLLNGKESPTYPKGKKIVFITMDDGPNTSTTARNLDTFKKAGVHATFYNVGLSLGNPKVQELMKRQYAEGHAVAVHSNSHDYSFLYPGRHCNPANVAKDFDALNAKMKNILGPGWSSNTFRYPGGHMSWKDMAPCDAVLAKKGVYWLDWNAGTNDAVPKRSQPKNPETMMQAVMQTAGDKNVVVLLSHDANGKEMTVKTMPKIIDYFKSKGYEFGIIGG